ncbi:putative 40S ribosomal protein S7 [Gregarina niphandrodes]|uniref:40S ribosomal protein S7 n=1 Tax=Gregarina niphandrodes TaxID=110365 RepID=A0A023BC48_GRENI|nr:putative 40S ribosomal protein S7 [Gregarina niphandrodes]EZG82122.1 putative 40S ribosomal protein S7 [Gregarina niphandrodes]|eukprot:XP_011129040.1 putative 40S ribosomal protein S7 [Gregarina niphandrodes]
MASTTDPLMQEVEQACQDIAGSSTSKELRASLSNIKIVKVVPVEVESTGKKALIVVVPYTQYKNQIKPNQGRCITELEKKTKRHVCIVALRTMLKPKSLQVGMAHRPYSRSLTAVQTALLDDISGPAEICGKRTRIGVDGKQCLKIYLDPKDKAKDNIEEKLATYGAVYQAITHKPCVFEFADYTL